MNHQVVDVLSRNDIDACVPFPVERFEGSEACGAFGVKFGEERGKKFGEVWSVVHIGVF